MSEFEVVWTDEMLDELFEFANEIYPDAMSVAINTADATGDYEPLTKVLNAANSILTDKALSHMVELGVLDIDGLDENGDYVFRLAEGVKLDDA